MKTHWHSFDSPCIHRWWRHRLHIRMSILRFPRVRRCCWKVGNVSNWGWLFVFPSVHLHVNFCCPFLKLWLLDLWQQCRHWIKGTTQFWSVDTEMGKKRSRSINSKVPSDESLDLKQQGGTSDLDLWLVVSWLHILVWLHYGSILWPSS